MSTIPLTAGDPQGFDRHGDCPICGGSKLNDRYSVNGFTITVCRECSQTFVREVLSQQSLQQYYAASPGDQVYWDPANEENLNFFDGLLKRSIERLRPSGRLLDIGCDRGRFLDVMKGWEVHGIEMSPGLAALARAKYGQNIHVGTLADYDGPLGYFDVITLLDTFDHLPDPYMTLVKCRSLLADGGLLVIKVHNISCLYARLSGSSFYAIIPPFHLYYYSPRTLGSLVSRAGFNPVAVRYFPHRLSLKTVFHRLSRGNEESLAFRIYAKLAGTRLGRVTLRKNLHDIMTLFASRDGLQEAAVNRVSGTA